MRAYIIERVTPAGLVEVAACASWEALVAACRLFELAGDTRDLVTEGVIGWRPVRRSPSSA